MNKAILIGRLTRDPEVRYSQGENAMAVARYTLAVERRFKPKKEDDGTDFISCVAFGKSAEFAEKYLRKGMKISVAGRIQTGSYVNKEGVKIYTTDVVAEEHGFCESKSSHPGGHDAASLSDGFMNVPDEIGEELPFH
ncbi:MAG: single-stranded DNA-binding protein [Lachnospiraceae bacterium]|nr:single-stranded DNA-binding protein [Lachnospiraceae bacterium]